MQQSNEVNMVYHTCWMCIAASAPARPPNRAPPLAMPGEGYPTQSDFWRVEQKIRAMLSGWWCNNHAEKYESQWEG